MNWLTTILWTAVLGTVAAVFLYEKQPHVITEREVIRTDYFVLHLEEDMLYLHDTFTGDCFSFLPTLGTGGPAMAHIPCRDRPNMVEFSSQ